MDIDTIEPGEDFVTVIEDAVGSCEILIAIIGRNWLSSTAGATERLNDPNDFVRVEIATALSRNIRVIPILVQRASMPKQQDLPEDLAKLARRNAIELSDLDWQNDVEQLISVMDRILAQREGAAWLTEAAKPAGERRRQAEVDKRHPEQGRQLRLTAEEAKQQAAEERRREEERKARKADRRRVEEDTQRQDAVTPFREHGGKRTILLVVIAAGVVLGIVVLIRMMKGPTGEQQSANSNAVLQLGQTTSALPTRAIQPPSGMVYVPGGEFMMGRNKSDGGDEYEHPAHEVTVKPFFIDLHEVTCEEYKKFLDANPDQVAPADWVNRNYPEGSARKPVTSVDWDRANAFAAWSSKRLPTEEEWEFAARATDGRLYPWGNVWEARLANVHTKNLTEAGKFPGLSPYGAVDMVGNAWEWTASPLTPYPNGTLSEQPAPDSKVIRGGSYNDSPNQATTTYRVGYPARSATDYSKIGLRCVSDATHTSKPR